MTRNRGVLDRYVRSDEERREFAEEAALAHVTLVLAELISASDLTQRRLAELLGVTEARVSQILDIDSNLTVRTIARIAATLGHRLNLQFVPEAMAESETPEPYPSSSTSGTWEAQRVCEPVIRDGQDLAA